MVETDDAHETLADVEKRVILARLTEMNGHRGRTAASLDIAVRTLQIKLRAWGVPPAVDGVAIACATVAKIEKPGESSCDRTGRFEAGRKVFWKPESFVDLRVKAVTRG